MEEEGADWEGGAEGPWGGTDCAGEGETGTAGADDLFWEFGVLLSVSSMLGTASRPIMVSPLTPFSFIAPFSLPVGGEVADDLPSAVEGRERDFGVEFKEGGEEGGEEGGVGVDIDGGGGVG